jgi:membrane associated rhomboid family serine protease
MASLMVMPKSTLSIGASGAVFGLFAVSAFTKLSWKALLDWRTLVEVVVLGEFFGYGIDHVGHLSGILAGIVVAMVMGTIIPKVT